MRAWLLAVLLVLLGTGPAVAQDADLYTERCLGGQTTACRLLGLMYETGVGRDQDIAGALEIYLGACASGDAIACTSVGLLYEKGRGVVEDPVAAAERYRRGCEGGALLACDLLTAIETEGPIRERRPFHTAGWVGDEEAGTVLEGVLVEIPRLDLQLVSDADGQVSFGRLLEGTYEIRAELARYEELSGVLNVPGHAEFVLLLNEADWAESSEPGWVVGQVVARDATPVSDVEIRLAERDDASVAPEPREGRFVLAGVEPGLVTLHVSRAGLPPAEIMLVVQPNRSSRVDVTLTAEGIELARVPF